MITEIPEAPNLLVSVLSFVGFVLALLPFPSHWKMSNTGTCLYMAWTAVGCFNQFINSVVWNKNVVNRAPVWCDISVRIIVGLSVAIPASALCILRHLHRVTSLRSIGLSKGEKRRQMVVDLSIGLGLPLLEILFEYFVQGHRFNILEDIGCYPDTYITPLAYLLVLSWPLAIGVVSAVYACLIIRACAKYYHTICNTLRSPSQHVNLGHYYRLSALCFIELLFTIPMSSFIIRANVPIMHPWKGWADDHYHFSRVDQIPAVLWRMDGAGAVSVEMSRFLLILCAFLIFGFFGFETRKSYWNALVTLIKPVSRWTVWLREACSGQKLADVHVSPFPSTFPSTEKGDPTLPVSTRQKLPPMRDFLASFSPNFYLSNFRAGDSVITLAEKQEAHLSLESSDVSSQLTTRSSSHRIAPDSPVLALPELAHIGMGHSMGSLTLDWRLSDNIV